MVRESSLLFKSTHAAETRHQNQLLSPEKSALPTKTVDNFVGTARIGVFSPARAGPQPLWRFNDRPENKQSPRGNSYTATWSGDRFFLMKRTSQQRSWRPLICASDSGAGFFLLWVDLTRGQGQLMALRLLALARTLVPPIADVPKMISSASWAIRTTWINRALNAARCRLRKSQMVQCPGKLPAASTRKATSS